MFFVYAIFILSNVASLFFPFLKLDPPDCRYLFLKGASVSFLNDEIWNLSSMQQGKYLYILSVTSITSFYCIYISVSIYHVLY